MNIQQRIWRAGGGWDSKAKWDWANSAQLVLAFGNRELLTADQPMREVQSSHPQAKVVGCSTAGEICDTHVSEDSLVITAVAFNSTRVKSAETSLKDASESGAAGARLAGALDKNGLVHVLVISDGLNVNGTELVKGLTGNLPTGVAVTGGLSGDGAKFGQTVVYHDGTARDCRIVAVGFYGDRLRVGYGSVGGWDPFGPERLVTRSRGNVLYELDGESALALYKKYLGSHAAGLPASGLRFPLTLRANAAETSVVRTILSINEADQSLTFAGDVPQGMYARLMRANFDRLVDGATNAARNSQQAMGPDSAELAILISCVGRRLILQQRTEEEVEGVRAVLGKRPAMTGFYSYGEISPFTPNAKCELHNQTMTVTVFSEAA